MASKLEDIFTSTFASCQEVFPTNAQIAKLKMLAMMGVVDAQEQQAARDALVRKLTKAPFQEAEEILKAQPDESCNEKVFNDLYIVMGVLFPTDRAIFPGSEETTYPRLRAYFERCLEAFGNAKDPRRNFFVGKPRVGHQIDCRPLASDVAVACERATAINAGQKKKVSQRDKEKAEKEQKKRSAAASKESKESSSSVPTIPAPELKRQLSLSESMARARLWKRLEDAGVKPYREKDPDLTAEKPVGHSTHNLFLKAKISKKESFLVLCTMRQSAGRLDLKKLAKQLKVKQLRMAKDKSCMCLETAGCITPLQLYNDTAGQCLQVIDKALLDLKSLRMCAGCDNARDHSQHNVVDISPSEIMTMLKESSHKEPVVLEFD